LSGLFAAARVPALQAGLQRLRVLHVLRGLLLTPSGCSPSGQKRLLCGRHQKQICFAVPARVAAGSVFDEEELNVALKITTREVDGVTVAALDGRIVLGEESNALREKIKSLVAEGKKKVVLNMDNITFIDSAGLGTLVASHHSAKAQGAALKLCHLGTKFQEVLQITKLMTIFDVYNTEAEAVASFSK
jgi:anti-sigma B factor antagonist